MLPKEGFQLAAAFLDVDPFHNASFDHLVTVVELFQFRNRGEEPFFVFLQIL